MGSCGGSNDRICPSFVHPSLDTRVVFSCAGVHGARVCYRPSGGVTASLLSGHSKLSTFCIAFICLQFVQVWARSFDFVDEACDRGLHRVVLFVPFCSRMRFVVFFYSFAVRSADFPSTGVNFESQRSVPDRSLIRGR